VQGLERKRRAGAFEDGGGKLHGYARSSKRRFRRVAIMRGEDTDARRLLAKGLEHKRREPSDGDMSLRAALPGTRGPWGRGSHRRRARRTAPQNPGFIAYHSYTAADGEALGVIRFETREALEAWRDDLTHRAIWPRATEFYEEFWIQNCDTYREYLWRDGRRQEADMTTMFRQADANLARTPRPPARAAKRQGQAPVAPTSHLSRRD
jgi:heme-degrading monooxygenase HmoA